MARLSEYPSLVECLDDLCALGFLPAGHKLHRTLRHVYMSATAQYCGDCEKRWAAHVNVLTVRPQCQRCFTRWCDQRGGLMRFEKAVRQYILNGTDRASIPGIMMRVDGQTLCLVARAHAEALALARWGSIAALEGEKARRDAVAAKWRARLEVKLTLVGLVEAAAAAAGEGECNEKEEDEEEIELEIEDEDYNEYDEESPFPPHEPVNRRENGEGVVADAVAGGMLYLVGFPAKDNPAQPLMDDVEEPYMTIICKYCDAKPELRDRLEHFPGYAELYEGHLERNCPNLPGDFFNFLY